MISMSFALNISYAFSGGKNPRSPRSSALNPLLTVSSITSSGFMLIKPCHKFSTTAQLHGLRPNRISKSFAVLLYLNGVQVDACLVIHLLSKLLADCLHPLKSALILEERKK